MRLTVYLPEDSPTIHDLTEERITVGRLSDNTIQLDDGSVSSHHGELLVQDGAVTVKDLGSTNGTFVNGEQVAEASLNDGDEVYFGKVRCTFGTARAVEPLPPPSPVRLAPSVGGATGRPADFRPLSPIPRETKKSDPLATAAWSLTGLAAVALGYALINILSI